MNVNAIPERSDTGPYRILVVDDDQFDRLAVRRSLQQGGITATVDEAASASDALALLSPGAYDCVLLDYYIPGVDTVTLLRRVRDAAGDVPVVIFTGRGGEEVAVELMKAGAVDYLPKASLTPERLATSFRYAQEMARAAAEKRRAENRLREREAEFRALANATPQLAWLADADGHRYWFNDRWYAYTGLRPDQSLGLGWHLAHHPDHRRRVIEEQLDAFRRGEEWEDTYPLRRADGEWRWFLSRAVPIRDTDGKVLRWIGTNTDISVRLEAERAVAASEERLRRALAIGTVGVAFFTVDGAITDANDAFLRMAGYTRTELSGGLVRWDDMTAPEYIPMSGRAIEELKGTGRTTPYEKQYVRKDGSRWWALFAATRLGDGEGVEFVVDITAQKQAEAERERLLASERTAREHAEKATRLRDDVLAVLAHDLRNPLNTILTAVSMLTLTTEAEKRHRHLKMIERAGRRMERLVTDLLDIARIEAGTFAIRPERLDAKTLILEVVDLCEAQAAARHIVVRADVRPDARPLLADRDRLVQVLSNLVDNAVKFSEPGGEVVVGAANVGGVVQISVCDAGRGIREDDLPHVFDRFWQASRASRAGAGLGLAICKGIVEAHGGRIWATSTVGRGTTVFFEIPDYSSSAVAGT